MQYGLPRPGSSHRLCLVELVLSCVLVLAELVCSDQSIPVWRDSCRFDAIVCDPPYGADSFRCLSGRFVRNFGVSLRVLFQGVRAGAKKSGTVKDVKPVLEEL